MSATVFPDAEQTRLLGYLLFQLRVLLSSEINRQSASPPHIRTAALFAYVIHNEAMAAYEGQAFNMPAALEKLFALDLELGENIMFAYREDGSVNEIA